MCTITFVFLFHTLEYSAGAIYLCLNNLPRNLRYKRENIIIVGIIPGPSEPKLTMNLYSIPLVQDLMDWGEYIL